MAAKPKTAPKLFPAKSAGKVKFGAGVFDKDTDDNTRSFPKGKGLNKAAVKPPGKGGK